MLIMRLSKKLSSNNTFIMPRQVVEKFGKEFFLEVYDDKLVIVPAEKKEKK